MTTHQTCRHTRQATALLLAVTAAGGSSFYLIRDVVTTLPAADFMAARFVIAAVVMCVALRRQLLALTRRQALAGAGLGVIYGAAQLLQTFGLEHTTATRSGFITGMTVVLTPALAALVLRARVPVVTWTAAGASLVGLAVLSLGSVGWGIGETLTLASAALFSVYILALGTVSKEGATLGLAAVQVVAVAAVCTIAALPGGVSLPGSPYAWAVVVYLALVCGAAARWAQTWAQTHLTPTRAVIVLTAEPVFAAVFATAFGGESLTGRVVLGGSMVLAAMYLSGLWPQGRVRAEQCPSGADAGVLVTS